MVTKETYDRVLATLERIYGPASYDARLLAVAGVLVSGAVAGCVRVPGAQVCAHYDHQPGGWRGADQTGASVCVDVARKGEP